MAVTEAGCDLTYCKMRGIVAVLTGEPKKMTLLFTTLPKYSSLNQAVNYNKLGLSFKLFLVIKIRCK